MKADPIIEELWSIKDDLAAESKHDLKRLFESLKNAQEDSKWNLVSRLTKEPLIAESSKDTYHT